MTPHGSRPDISVIIPTHNRPASLLRLLHALQDGSFPASRFEVVVIADGCTDDTAVVVRTVPWPFSLQVLEQNPGRGAGPARNLGVSHASGDLLVFVDDDIEPLPTFLAEHHRTHAEAGVPAVAIGPALPVRTPDSNLDTIEAWAWWEDQLASIGRPGHRFRFTEIFSGDLSIPADLFRSVGGFDVSFPCREDFELGIRLIRAGARVLFAAGAGGLHHELRDYRRLIRRKRAEGEADVRLARLHPEVWSELRISSPEAPIWNPLGILRRAALVAPWIAHLMVRGLGGTLPLLEGLHLRGTWRKAQAGVMYGWYWLGVRDGVGSRRGLQTLEQKCESPILPSADLFAIDLDLGLDKAEQLVEQTRPTAIRVRFGPLEVGTLAAKPGAEPFRGEHLRPALADELPQALLAAMTTSAAAGNPGAPRLVKPAPAPLRPAVSVIIAAHNAAGAIRETLESLSAQTHREWEAIVVDDGSDDATATIVQDYAAHDSRVRLLRQQQNGPGPARNRGMAAARHHWLLFLDADDWLLPKALQQLGDATLSGTVDAVHGGWARVGRDGRVMETEFAPPTTDLFLRFAEICAFPINACLFRRELTGKAGGFDPALRTCEDWDFWQRIARTGARFGRVSEKVAHYRIQLRSGATSTARLLPDGLTVITRGHGSDPREPGTVHSKGAPREGAAGARLRFVAWVAGMMIGRGESLVPVLQSLKSDSDPGLSPTDIAGNLFSAVPLGVGKVADAWDDLWPEVAADLSGFLTTLEQQSGSWQLARRSLLVLERLTLDLSRAPRPFTRGRTHAVAVDITKPIDGIQVSDQLERVHCAVMADGERIGEVVLPVFDGVVSARVLADAIAARFAWPILGRFFGATLYRELAFRRTLGGILICRDGAPLAASIRDEAAVVPERLHDHVGWTLFLQELWGLSPQAAAEIYQEGGSGAQSPRREAGWKVVEVSDELPTFQTPDSEVTIEPRVGGVAVGLISVPSEGGRITSSRLRSVITTEAGFELCRVAVREGILGRPFEGGRLRKRLAEAAKAYGPAAPSYAEVIPPEAADLMTLDWPSVVGHVAGSDETLCLSRYRTLHPDAPADRRADLPRAVIPELLAAAAMGSPPAVRSSSEGSPQRVAYLPELVSHLVPARDQHVGASAGSAEANQSRPHDRHHFESLFARGEDPWAYETPYERTKYQQTLELIPDGRIARALELACAEGRFTRLLAPRVERLIAADFSQVALRRAEAASTATNVQFQLLDLVTDDLPGPLDLIVCSEVLYFLGNLDVLKAVGEKLAGALSPGGHLVLAHANVLADDPDQPGFDWAVPYGARRIGETLAAIPHLRFLREIRTEAYRIQLFKRRASPNASAVPLEAEVVEAAPYQEPEPHVAVHFRRAGGRPMARPSAALDPPSLPILMYHSISTDGPAATARYRVRPDAFEAQLRYLRAAGFTTVALPQWFTAVRRRRPLPARPVVITFDDGYRDFEANAWPLLQRYGFGALVFLVAELIGDSARWDAHFGEPLPLMCWEEIRRLASQGVEFGAHSASHRPMTGLTPTEIAREAIRSRVIIERGLGQGVDTIAYPYGDTDPIVEHVVGASGFQLGLTCRPGPAGPRDSALALPRIEVSGDDDLASFIGKLG
jgi:glycosyltransferase involved in cell wall biosynthesis/peptidoglycan/xylan/chitin deacetylase (PgdA/CDA1 family)/SAM-dependent methyltransferase